MKIKFFLGSANSYSEQDILLRFAEGVTQWAHQENQAQGIEKPSVQLMGRWSAAASADEHTVEYEQEEGYSACDVAVMFGSWKPREKGYHIIRTSVAANSRCFICIETPLLKRRTDVLNSYWRMGINGFLRDAAEWPDYHEEVADRRLKDWGISWPGWRNNADGHVVIALQLPGDASLRGININDWAYHTVLKIREKTQRRIIVRNHPLASLRAFGDHEELARRLMMEGINNIRFSDGQLRPWSEDIKGAYCTVTYTSGLAIDSVLAGIPTVACNPGNFAFPFSTRFPDEIENLRLGEPDTVQRWLRWLSLCQYSVPEMQSGLAWRHLLPTIQRVLER